MLRVRSLEVRRSSPGDPRAWAGWSRRLAAPRVTHSIAFITSSHISARRPANLATVSHPSSPRTPSAQRGSEQEKPTPKLGSDIHNRPPDHEQSRAFKTQKAERIGPAQTQSDAWPPIQK